MLGLPSDDQVSSVETPSYGELTEVIESLKAGAVKSPVNLIHFVVLLIFGLLGHDPHALIVAHNGCRVGRHPILQVVHIVRMMELANFLLSSCAPMEYPHGLGQVEILY